MTGKPFDATLRRLMAIDPPSWLALLGQPAEGPARVIDSDVSTITAGADGVFEVGDPPRFLAHVEFQSGRDPSLARRLLHYNVLLHHRREVPVRTVVLLLRREAEDRTLTGTYRLHGPDGAVYLDFRYDVLRLWSSDVGPYLEGGLGLLPLAPLAKVAKSRLPAVVDRMKRRLDREVSPADAGELWAATTILMGLEFRVETLENLLRGVMTMEESSTYQAIIRKGEIRGEIKGEIRGDRKTLLRQGRKRFGEPDASTLATIEAIEDVETMERLLDRLLDVNSWSEMLGPDPSDLGR